jgi:hypothetical protein
MSHLYQQLKEHDLSWLLDPGLIAAIVLLLFCFFGALAIFGEFWERLGNRWPRMAIFALLLFFLWMLGKEQTPGYVYVVLLGTGWAMATLYSVLLDKLNDISSDLTIISSDLHDVQDRLRDVMNQLHETKMEAMRTHSEVVGVSTQIIQLSQEIPDTNGLQNRLNDIHIEQD